MEAQSCWMEFINLTRNLYCFGQKEKDGIQNTYIGVWDSFDNIHCIGMRRAENKIEIEITK